MAVTKEDINHLRRLAVECLWGAEAAVGDAMRLWPVPRRRGAHRPSVAYNQTRDVERRSRHILKMRSRCKDDVTRWDYANLDSALDAIRTATTSRSFQVGAEVAATAHEAAVAAARFCNEALVEAHDYECESDGERAQFMVDRIRELPPLRRLEGIIHGEAAAAVRMILTESGTLKVRDEIMMKKGELQNALSTFNRKWSAWMKENRHALRPGDGAKNIESAKDLWVTLSELSRTDAVLIINRREKTSEPV